MRGKKILCKVDMKEKEGGCHPTFLPLNLSSFTESAPESRPSLLPPPPSQEAMKLGVP